MRTQFLFISPIMILTLYIDILGRQRRADDKPSKWWGRLQFGEKIQIFSRIFWSRWQKLRWRYRSRFVNLCKGWNHFLGWWLCSTRNLRGLRQVKLSKAFVKNNKFWVCPSHFFRLFQWHWWYSRVGFYMDWVAQQYGYSGVA